MTRSMPGRPLLGVPLPDWQPPQEPSGQVLEGHHARLEPLDPDVHAAPLYEAYKGHDQVWDYLPYGPFASLDEYRDWMRRAVALPAVRFYAIRNLTQEYWQGVASYLRIDPPAGSIEVGHINFSPALQGTTAATEAMFLMMRWAFEAGYRRYEWKCDALNAPSRRAAQRLGFSYEGVFRQATVVKGRNRDTAWFAITDGDWRNLKPAFEAWLSQENFRDGSQRHALRDLTAPVRVSSDPTL